MQLPKIDVQPRKLVELLYEMQAGKLQIPRFQRDFVWPLTKTRALFDSMYKEFPIGTFFLWRAPAGSVSLIRPLDELGIPVPASNSEVSYILDGQQRLTSLYVTIKGITLASADYGRLCIDLKTATTYEANKDEGFEENIFVYTNSDNQRYIAVKDMIGPSNLMIFNTIRPEWQAAFNKAYNLFQTYPFSVVWIQEQTLGDAIEIFQRINQAGKRLSRYDLVCANVWAEHFDFRKLVAVVNEKFARDGFGKLDETIFTQTFALILNNKCTTDAELSLQTADIERIWEQAIKALQLAVNFVVNNMGVKRADFLPYRGILVVLAYYFYHSPTSAISAAEREALWKWFWRITLSERYSSTSPSKMAEDATKLRDLLNGQPVAFDYPSKVTPEAVARTKMTSNTSALRNAVLCLLALKQPKNLKDNSPVNLADEFFANLKQPERHHLFPVGYLKSRNQSASWVHLMPNFCFIASDLNKEIGSQAPATYLAWYKKDNPQFAGAAKSHLLPVDAEAAVWKNDFHRFLLERAQLIAAELNRLIDRAPDPLVGEEEIPVSALAEQIDLLEVRLRDFIDQRLTAVVGPYYWRQTMPGDVITAVKELIAEYISRHPYESHAKFASGRSRLDFCDVSHYEKIIFRNWAQFEEVFKRKDDFQRHMTAFRTLRNPVQHNRPPSDIEQQLGKTALTWFQRILSKYDRDIRPLGELIEDEEEVVAEAVEE